MEYIKCYIHDSIFPRATCHLHHESPRYTGGSDDPDNLVWLCANCHTLVHRAASLVLLNRSGEVDQLEFFYDNERARGRFREVFGEIVLADIKTMDSKRREFAPVRIDVRSDVYSRLKLLVADTRYYGRRMSIERYLNMLIEDHLKKKGLIS